MIKHCLNTVKHRLLVEKDRGNACRKNQEKKRAVFFWRIFLEVSVFTAPAVRVEAYAQVRVLQCGTYGVHRLWSRVLQCGTYSRVVGCAPVMVLCGTTHVW
jgi:hypothetical protein